MSRSNDRVADALDELAQLLAISGRDPNRVRSFEKAARAVRGYPREVDTLDAAGLDEIPAVGPHVAARILGLHGTGTMPDLEELRAQVPAGLQTLLGVPGLGPAGRTTCTRSSESPRSASCWTRRTGTA